MTETPNPLPDIKALEWKAAQKRGNVAAAGLGIVLISSVFEWIAFHHGLQRRACVFEDSLLLRSLWPPNVGASGVSLTAIFSPADRCVFFAMRSSFSVLMFISGVILSVIQIRSVNDLPPTKGAILYTTIGLVGFSLFYMFGDGLSDYNGRYAWYGFHADEGVEAAMIKSAVRIFIWYALLFVAFLNFWYTAKRDSQGPGC